MTRKKKQRVIYGKWTECMYSVDSKIYEAARKAEKKAGGDSKKQKQVIHQYFPDYSASC